MVVYDESRTSVVELIIFWHQQQRRGIVLGESSKIHNRWPVVIRRESIQSEEILKVLHMRCSVISYHLTEYVIYVDCHLTNVQI